MTAVIAPEVVQEHGLRPAEYESIVRALGRTPTITELGIYSVLWSEHCSYKHSKKTLRLFPTTGPRVVVGPGENAGVVDIGDGLVVVFKMESHNHPSAVEPYQGAATGVGGILRDIFTMGARPIALLDNLRFGEPDAPGMLGLIEGVIEGIAGYGNCIGVPVIAGDSTFDREHADNILVNAMCVGIARREDLLLAHASGPGNKLLYFGSATGRDGIHGATFASEELSEEALGRRGAVQVGDSFMGKKILEATLELIRRDLVVGMQDMGAAGLTSSSCEMAGRAGTGITLNLDHVPQRAAAMTAYEMMLSESQERMLAVVTPGNVAAALEVCARWECGGAVIGEVTDDGRVRISHNGEVVADLPALHLTANAPLYDPAIGLLPVHASEPKIPMLSEEELRQGALRILTGPAVASKRWIWERYDHQVGASTVVPPGAADAGVIRIRAEEDRGEKYLAAASGCNHRYVALEPRLGGQLAVCEVARKLACVGAESYGMTNCLNFGSPERPEVFAQFHAAVTGMAEACRALEIPVTGGNVSLYNEKDGVAIPPTPMVGMVGLIADRLNITPMGFQEEGDRICVLGRAPTGIGGSEADRVLLGAESYRGRVDFVLEEEVALQHFLRLAIRSARVCSAHSVGKGGLFAALAECALASPEERGAFLSHIPGGIGVVGLFGELPPRVLVTVPEDVVGLLQQEAAIHRVPFQELGSVAERDLVIEGLPPFSRHALSAAFNTTPEAHRP